MKYFVLALCVLGTALAAPSSDNEFTASEEQFLNNFLENYDTEIEKYVKIYVKKSMKEIAEAACENKNIDFEGPLEEVFRRAEQVDEESDTIYGLIRNNLEHVLEPLTSAIDGCLPNTKAGVANYFGKAFVSVVKYICQSTGEQILEIFNPCLAVINYGDNKCVENVSEKWNEITSVTKTTFKEEVCSEYVNVRPCLETAVSDHCKFAVTKDSMLGLFDSVFKDPCSA